jgi:hypothetical protein
MPNLTDEQKDKANAEMKSFEAVVNSMTPYERRHPETLKYSREEPDCQRQWQDQRRREPGDSEVGTSQRAMMKQMKQYQKSGKIPPGFGGR